MKHKAQESLDILSYPLDDSSCGGCKCGTSDCRDCKKAIAVFNIEDLINCQLTVEEIDNLILCTKILGVFKALNDEPLEKTEVFISLQKKLHKLKEMWEEE